MRQHGRVEPDMLKIHVGSRILVLRYAEDCNKPLLGLIEGTNRRDASVPFVNFSFKCVVAVRCTVRLGALGRFQDTSSIVFRYAKSNVGNELAAALWKVLGGEPLTVRGSLESPLRCCVVRMSCTSYFFCFQGCCKRAIEEQFENAHTCLGLTCYGFVKDYHC